MKSIGTYLYDGFPLETKHAWMQTGPGVSAATLLSDALAQLSADFGAADANIGRNFIKRKVGAEWTGQAAEGAAAAIDRAAAALAAQGHAGQAGSGSVDQYGQSFVATKNAIPEPPRHGVGSALASSSAGTGAVKGAAALGPVGAAVGYGAGAASDYFNQQAAYQQADQRANDALLAHEQNTRGALTAFQNAIDSDANQPSTTSSASADPSAISSQQTTPAGGTGQPGGAPPGGAAAGAGGAQQPSGAVPSGGSGPGATGPSGAPLAPRPTGALDGMVRTPNGSFVPAANVASSGTAAPPMPPVGGGYPGNGGGHRTGLGGGLAQPLTARGTGALPTDTRVNGFGAAPSESVERQSGRGGVPVGGVGGVGKGGEDKEHRNDVYIPDDSPFRLTDDDDELGVVPSVITPEYLQRYQR